MTEEEKPQKKTFGQEVLDAQKMSGYQSVEDTWQAYQPKFIELIKEAVSKGEQAGLTKFYIWILIRKPPEAPNIMQICPYIRTTEPEPWKAWDHYCYEFNKKEGLKLLWSVPRPEVMNYILTNPHGFDPSYVRMLKKVKKRIDSHIASVNLFDEIGKLNKPIKKFNRRKVS